MRKIAILSAITLLAVPAVVIAKKTPVTICHATSSDTNPWVRIVTDDNATGGHFDNNGTTKAGHEKDVLLQDDVACPAPVAPPTNPVVPNTPTETNSAVTPAITVPTANTDTDMSGFVGK